MSPGTRFRLYPQWNEGWTAPETVILSSPLGSLGPGPESGTMRAILPLNKAAPYDPPRTGPPYDGACAPAARPDRHGDFDHVDPLSPQFLPVHLFGCVRWTLDIWEAYLRQEIVWWHAPGGTLELVALLDWNNAQSGPGFIEMGLRTNREGERQLFALNLDVVAHETGHTILFATAGVPPVERLGGAFLAFHESFSDLIAMVAALHFPSVAARLLTQTAGNLYVLNLISRIGELSSMEQIRTADNAVTMADVADLRLEPDGSWFDPAGEGRNAHALAQPLTGAVFDLFVEIYHERLAARGGLPDGVDTRRWDANEARHRLRWSLDASARAMAHKQAVFDAALAEARDALGRCMAYAIHRIDVARLTFDAVAGLLLEAAGAQLGMPPMQDMVDIFLIRGIDPRPMLRPARGTGPAPYAAQIAVSRRGRQVRESHAGCRCSAGAFALAQSFVRHPERERPTRFNSSR